MTLPTLKEAREMAQGPLTPEQLRAISDAALMAMGWRVEKQLERTPDFSYYSYTWFMPDGSKLLSFDKLPDPAADLTDAERWMVPDETEPHGFDRLQKWPSIPSPIPYRDAPFRAWVGATQKPIWASTPALALTLAGWAAKEMER